MKEGAVLDLINKIVSITGASENGLYLPLTVFILVDYITGICLAIKRKRLSSKIGFNGIVRKILMYVVAFLGKVIDRFVLSSATPVESMILLFYISNEGISILENLSKLDVPFPARIQQIFTEIIKDPEQENN